VHHEQRQNFAVPEMTEAINNGYWTPANWEQYDAYADLYLRKEPLYEAILDSKPVQRLHDVGFLGAITSLESETISEIRPFLSRYSHSASVAYLTSRACKNLGFPEATTKTLVSAALLHDVGHGALSHSIEPYFKRRFGLCHKHMGERLIRGDLFLGDYFSELLHDFAIEADDIIEYLSNKTRKAGAALFNSPINVDTIDGISRSACFFSSRSQRSNPENILDFSVCYNAKSAETGDLFWNLKNEIYSEYIYSSRWAIYDARIDAALQVAALNVSGQDFLLTDTQFLRKYRTELRGAKKEQQYLSTFKRETRLRELGEAVAARRFVVRQEIELTDQASFHKRYETVTMSDQT
jgi:uncharacterized protein